uniref:Uncharacterized protein n=1 Tax=Wuchereria bancrofti TaxID=6293 RepID=A0A1I8EEE4_WUCBA
MYQGVLFALGGGTGAANMPQNPFQNVSDAAAMVTGLNLATTLKNPLYTLIHSNLPHTSRCHKFDEARKSEKKEANILK